MMIFTRMMAMVAIGDDCIDDRVDDEDDDDDADDDHEVTAVSMFLYFS